MKPIEVTKLYGYNNYIKKLIDITKNNKLPNRILISGSEGIGKSILGYHISNYLLSLHEKNSYDFENNIINEDNRSFKLINNLSHPNFVSLKKKVEKKYIEISQIRDLNNFINKSSFNNDLKIVLIDDAEYLSNSSGNALLKILEEPNNNVQFIIIYNNSKYILETIKSRCIEFKVGLHHKYVPEIINTYFNENIYDKIHNSYKNVYFKPIDFINLINLFKENDYNIENTNLENLVKKIINNKLYKFKHIEINFIKSLIEAYFISKFRIKKDNNLYKISNYLNKRFSETMKFNLDIETYFFDLKLNLFNEK